MSMELRARGFTLLEMLVTLVVVGLVAGVLSQALFQLSRVERLMAGGQMHSLAQAIRVEWLRLALSSLQPGEPGRADRFKGGAQELNGLSTAVPRFPSPTLAAMRLSLRFNPELGLTELLLAEPASGTSGTSGMSATEGAIALLSWPGQQGRFRYQDGKGAWHDSWPPMQSGAVAAAALPSLIALETGLEDMSVLLAAPLAVDVGAPSRQTLEQF